MGQRVNIILAVENKENKKKVYVYHDQWGIGRKSLLNLISIHHAFYNKAYEKKHHGNSQSRSFPFWRAS